MQRLILKNKGYLPHMLVMSATPIPRSVAMTRYGDLELSVINEMPGGERKVKTKIVDTMHLPQIYEFMAKEIQGGAKVYIVCPLVEESEKIEAADSIQKAEEMKKIFPQYNILLLHGRMSSQEKEQVMQAFKEPGGHILVSTTVIEVGIDIPEASIILIENAERFGLAQLHQLRGRVGRKSQQSYCFLSIASVDGKKRLAIMEKTNSGFLIAEEDLAQRGPGEIFGEQQSGFLSVSLVDMEKDLSLLESAKKIIPVLVTKKEWESKIVQEIEYRRQNIAEKELMTIG
jgi:ATP-dependent DNA helicase RecG